MRTVLARRHSPAREGHERRQNTPTEIAATTGVQYHAHAILDKPPALRYRKSTNAVILDRLSSERISEIASPDTLKTAVTFENGPVSGTSSSPREIKGGDGLKDAGNTDRPTNIRPVLRTKGVYP